MYWPVSQQTAAGTDGERANAGKRTGRQSNEPYLLDGEEVLVDARPAWTNWLTSLVIGGLLVLFGLIGASQSSGALGLLVLGAAILGYVAYQRKKVRYVVTDRRVMVATGISSMSTNEAWMVDVRGMQTGATFVERLLGHGHISLSTSILGRGSLLSFANLNGMTLGGIANHQEIADTIRRRQAEVKHR